MKKIIHSLLVLFFLLNPNPLTAGSDYLTGDDWALMSNEEKATYLFNLIQLLENTGLNFSKSIKDYVLAIDNQIMDDASLEKKDIKDIFILLVYRDEPDTRVLIDSLSSPPANATEKFLSEI